MKLSGQVRTGGFVNRVTVHAHNQKAYRFRQSCSKRVQRNSIFEFLIRHDVGHSVGPGTWHLTFFQRLMTEAFKAFVYFRTQRYLMKRRTLLNECRAVSRLSRPQKIAYWEGHSFKIAYWEGYYLHFAPKITALYYSTGSIVAVADLN